MKKGSSFWKSFRKRSVILALVSLLLVSATAVGVTVSWIEDVSQVEFNNTDGQETPLHVGNKVLKSDAVMKNMGNSTDTVVSLSDYFNESGDMHLSPCYSDGENFYFPIEKKTGEDETLKFRTGTKDDANVNYLSATFRIRSEGADTAYWFEKTGTDSQSYNSKTPYITFFKDGSAISSSAQSNLQKKLRCSVTIDGTTNVYALNNTGAFKTVSGNRVTAKDGKRIDQYAYFKEVFNNNSPEGYYKSTANNSTTANKLNQGEGENLNGNTLFRVAKYDSTNADTKKKTVKTVTVKIWLEHETGMVGSDYDNIKVGTINMNFVSSWAKTRRIYVKDATVHQTGYSSANWLSAGSSKLYFALRENLGINWQMTRVTGTNYYYADIPAVYNNSDCVFLRFTSSGWNNGSVLYEIDDENGFQEVYCSEYWNTTFPDTFHSEVYTVYSKEFATWEPSDKVSSIYFINSQRFSNADDNDYGINGKNFKNIYDYMWDSNSEITNQTENGQTAKVVKNAVWPGMQMKTKMATSTSSQGLDTYAFFFNADYNKIIFNDGDVAPDSNNDGSPDNNYEFQTEDLDLSRSQNNQTYDMATLTWFDTTPDNSNWSTRIPSYSGDTTFIHGNFVTDNRWRRYRFAYDGQYDNSTAYNDNAFINTSSSNMVSKVYIKTSDSSDYEFVVFYNGTCYKAGNNCNLYAGNMLTLYSSNNGGYQNAYAKNLTKGIYRFYLKNANSNSLEIHLASGAAAPTPKN